MAGPGLRSVRLAAAVEGDFAMNIQAAPPRLLSAALWLIVLFIVVYVLIIAREFLIPFVLAVFIWYLINLIMRQLARIRVAGWQLPSWVQFLLAGSVIVAAGVLFARMLTANVGQVMEAAPAYQANVNRLLQDIVRRLGMDDAPALTALLRDVDFAALLRGAATALGTFLGNIGLVVVYLVFLFLEQRFFRAKLDAILVDAHRRESVAAVLSDIDRDIATYIGIKTLVSVLTATGAWAVMRIVGLDFAGFWAILIFILNFVPNIGSLVATLLPALLALMQFDTLGPFVLILFGVGGIQVIVGNFLEPNLMSRSLNISPLVVLLSLVAWGSIWGIPGMFLCVPITVVLMIVLFHFDSTRWIARLLSKNGQMTPASARRSVTDPALRPQ
jgi:AI-2 transport protein TqsA